MAPRRKCNVCGSQQWHKEPATGLVVCSEGHVLQVWGCFLASLLPSLPPAATERHPPAARRDARSDTLWWINLSLSQDYRNETYEAHAHELGTTQGHRRALKSTREKRGRANKANPERTQTPFSCHQSLPRCSDPCPLIRWVCSLLWRTWGIPSFPMSATLVAEAGRRIDPALEASG